MKFSVAAVIAAAAAVQAGHAGHNVSYTTEIVTALTTYCPYATTVENNGVTYTITEATTLTITNCPCTVTKPVTTYSSVICNSCSANSTAVSVAPTTPVAPITTKAAATTTAAAVVTAGAGKAAALSGAGLAGVLGLAAFVL